MATEPIDKLLRKLYRKRSLKLVSKDLTVMKPLEVEELLALISGLKPGFFRVSECATPDNVKPLSLTVSSSSAFSEVKTGLRQYLDLISMDVETQRSCVLGLLRLGLKIELKIVAH